MALTMATVSASGCSGVSQSASASEDSIEQRLGDGSGSFVVRRGQEARGLLAVHIGHAGIAEGVAVGVRDGGRVVVTNGPLLRPSVNGQPPGRLVSIE